MSLFDVALKITLILGVAGLATALLRNRTSALRYYIWTCALSAALATPFLSAALDKWNVRLNSPIPVALAVPGAEPVMAGSHAKAVPITPAAPRFSTERTLRLIWLSGLAAFLIRLLSGHWSVQRILARSEEIRGRAGVRRSAEVEIPLSYGVFRPVVIVPAESDHWTRDRWNVVLTHERIHLRRMDPLWSLFAQLAAALYWFHPLAWVALAGFRREQERSCDDAVLASGVLQSDYAHHLVGVARSASQWVEAPGMARRADFEDRVRALLDPARRRSALSRRAQVAALAAVAICVLPLAALRGQDPKPMSSLSGSVYDPSKAALPQTTITLKYLDGTAQEVAVAGAAGEYVFPRVRSGRYDLEARARGFAPLIKRGITLNPGTAEHMDLVLDLGQISETLDIVAKSPRPAPAPMGAPKRIRVGGNVQATKLSKSVRPEYPQSALEAGTTGTVLLRAVISTTGELLNLSVINTADAELAKAATDAVSKWRYEPTLLNGVPVEVVTTITVNFKLQQ